ncbi:hypothetical protein NLI96_g1072 [Meripilus lineatus]|uniref:Mediator of RNA polymerase II transcription subunit 31 n=1 Tax=Meripilus lineatus TaxID=2056292 RepID=A0AAD5YIR7_9APHY|nr:hypothetical protein NLI96_g1072 [Physisporinus lineatus]
MEEQPEYTDPRVANRRRFELELEFVQSLANPFYLQSLAQQGILNQPAFVNFLKYLLYWKEKDYARFLLYAGRILTGFTPSRKLTGILMLCITWNFFNTPNSALRSGRMSGGNT